MPLQDLAAGIFIIQFQCIEDDYYMTVRHCVFKADSLIIQLVFVG